MPGTIPAVALLIVRSDPGVGTFDFDRQKPSIPGINSEAVTRSVPRGFLNGERYEVFICFNCHNLIL